MENMKKWVGRGQKVPQWETARKVVDTFCFFFFSFLAPKRLEKRPRSDNDILLLDFLSVGKRSLSGYIPMIIILFHPPIHLLEKKTESDCLVTAYVVVLLVTMGSSHRDFVYNIILSLSRFFIWKSAAH
jgi:hypothetical protein